MPTRRWRRGWEIGLLLSRDIPCNQLPGAVYLFWFLGGSGGMGRKRGDLRVRRGAIVVLGLVLVTLEPAALRRGLSGARQLPCFLSSYLGLDYSLAAQRNWRAPFFAVLGILILQTWGGTGRGAGDLGRDRSAMAIMIRPHAVLFLPAVAMQLLGERRTGSGDLGGRPSGSIHSC